MNESKTVDLGAIEKQRAEFCLQCGPEGACRSCQELEINYTRALKSEVESLRELVKEMEEVITMASPVAFRKEYQATYCLKCDAQGPTVRKTDGLFTAARNAWNKRDTEKKEGK